MRKNRKDEELEETDWSTNDEMNSLCPDSQQSRLDDLFDRNTFSDYYKAKSERGSQRTHQEKLHDGAQGLHSDLSIAARQM